MLHDEKWDLDEDGKVIWGVALYIEEHGWCQGIYGDHSGKGPVCILGAYRAIHNDEFHKSVGRIHRTLYNICGLSSIVDWNDVEGRTKEEVVTMLKQAAKTRDE